MKISKQNWTEFPFVPSAPIGIIPQKQFPHLWERQAISCPILKQLKKQARTTTKTTTKTTKCLIQRDAGFSTPCYFPWFSAKILSLLRFRKTWCTKLSNDLRRRQWRILDPVLPWVWGICFFGTIPGGVVRTNGWAGWIRASYTVWRTIFVFDCAFEKFQITRSV